MDRTLPAAREKGLIVQDVADETLVYDLQRHRAYCLNRTAALVWRHCDGVSDVDQVVADLSEEMGTQASEALVWLALRRLQRNRLLEERATGQLAARYTRRRVIQTLAALGIGAAVLPTIISVVAPTAAQAATCVEANACVGMPYGTPCKPPDCDRICCGPDGPRPGECRPAADCV